MYNWYFGNSIAVYEIDNESYLFSAGGDELNELCKFLTKKTAWSVLNKRTKAISFWTAGISSYSRKKSDIAPSISVDLRLSVSGSGPIYDIVTLPNEGNFFSPL